MSISRAIWKYVNHRSWTQIHVVIRDARGLLLLIEAGSTYATLSCITFQADTVYRYMPCLGSKFVACYRMIVTSSDASWRDSRNAGMMKPRHEDGNLRERLLLVRLEHHNLPI